MTVRLYMSTDPDAPPLRGNTPGDLINLLEKCLVTGYGDKAPAGWSKPYSSGAVAVFRTGSGSNGMYLRVDDSMVRTASGQTRWAAVSGYESMSDVDTGAPVDFAPPNSRAWLTMHGSDYANRDNARPWAVVADEAFVYYLPVPHTGEAGWRTPFMFGDLARPGPADLSATILNGTDSTSSSYSIVASTMANANFFSDLFYDGVRSALQTNATRVRVPRSYTQTGDPTYVGLLMDGAWRGWNGSPGNGNTPTNGGGLSLDAASGTLPLSPIAVFQPSGPVLRGWLPGAYAFAGPVSYLNDLDTFEGTGDLAGRTFLHRKSYGGSSQQYAINIELGNWR